MIESWKDKYPHLVPEDNANEKAKLVDNIDEMSTKIIDCMTPHNITTCSVCELKYCGTCTHDKCPHCGCTIDFN